MNVRRFTTWLLLAVLAATAGLGKAASWGGKAAGWAFRQAVETAGDTLYDVAVRGDDWRYALAANAVGNVAGEGPFYGLGRAMRPLRPYAGRALRRAGDWIGPRLAPRNYRARPGVYLNTVLGPGGLELEYIGPRHGRHLAPNRGAGVQGRDELGRFVSRRPGQAIPGAGAVDDFAAHAQRNGMDVLGRNVHVNTPFGQRSYDLVVRNRATGRITGVEIKSSSSAFTRFDEAARHQFAADRWLNTQGGLQGVGRNSDIFIDDTMKILWEAP